MTKLELWGGYECTVNRVGDRFFDQTIRSGHQHRIEDLALFAELGMTSLRYPALWERISPHVPDERDFAWTDERLAELRRLGINPIVGLTHHGSGPAYTNMLSNSFAPGLGIHARAVAERYPWVRDWTPVNEPLTTARFSCLYGFWYPHTRDEDACWLALLNEIDATRFAMREIRRVNPAARLVQTEDLGHAHSTRELAAQAQFENDRRWLTWDLLAGSVVPGHPLWERLASRGFADRLKAIADDPCPANVIGINHYLSSERFLDHRMDRHPGVPPAADADVPCVNVDALRNVAEGPIGPEALLREAWARYEGATLAITEAHNGCTREEQMRWFERVWRAAERVRAEGAPVEAVTAWSLLGAYDWNKLVTTDAGHYECGVYDLRGGTPRPTAMAHLLKALAAGEPAPHAELLAMPGWWERRDRFNGTPTRTGRKAPATIGYAAPDIAARPVLITGRTGSLGKMLASACKLRGLPHVMTDRSTLSIDDAAAIEAAFERIEPSAVVNAAGVACVERGEADPNACLRANAVGAELLAAACARRGIPFVTFSSDQVFDGAKGAAYAESDRTNPLNAYGRSKADAERRVLAAHDNALVVRTAAFFSPHDRHNFAAKLLTALRHGQSFAVGREHVSPTYLPDMAHAVLDLLVDGEAGHWHLANRDRLTWAEFGRRLAEAADLDASLVRPVSAAELGLMARRPADASLVSERGQMLGGIDAAIERFVAEFRPAASRTATVAARHGMPAAVGGAGRRLRGTEQ
jgi:dTDP-4-dehydrorhamnose reductase